MWLDKSMGNYSDRLLSVANFRQTSRAALAEPNSEEESGWLIMMAFLEVINCAQEADVIKT